MDEVKILYYYGPFPVRLDKMFRADNNYEERYLCNCDHHETSKYFIKSDTYKFRVCLKHLPNATSYVNMEITKDEINDANAEKFQQQVREKLNLEYERAPKCMCNGNVTLQWSLPNRVWCVNCGLYSTFKVPAKITPEEVTIKFVKSKIVSLLND